MPGYGTLPEGQGHGLLPWSWAEKRLASSHDYWLATVSGDGTPHLMPVWALWYEGRLWFSSSNGSRKARNLGSHPRCTVSTDNPLEPVVVQGRAMRVTDRDVGPVEDSGDRSTVAHHVQRVIVQMQKGDSGVGSGTEPGVQPGYGVFVTRSPGGKRTHHGVRNRQRVDPRVHSTHRHSQSPDSQRPCLDLVEQRPACAPRQQERRSAIHNAFRVDSRDRQTGRGKGSHHHRFAPRSFQLLRSKYPQRIAAVSSVDAEQRRIPAAAHRRHHDVRRHAQRGQDLERVRIVRRPTIHSSRNVRSHRAVALQLIGQVHEIASDQVELARLGRLGHRL